MEEVSDDVSDKPAVSVVFLESIIWPDMMDFVCFRVGDNDDGECEMMIFASDDIVLLL